MFLQRIVRRMLSTSSLINPNNQVYIEKLQPLLGTNTWIVQDADYDFYQEVANSAFADMLHDTERNQKYEQAIKAAIDQMHARCRPAKVLDIGAGTGLLSMMAVRCGADAVHCCETFRPMSECARRVIERNRMQNQIKVIPKHSRDLIVGQDLPEKCNILVTEVFDTELIGEGAISTFRHAHEQLLETDCIVVPHSATVFVQIVENPLVQNWNRLKDYYNLDGDRVIVRIPDKVRQCTGTNMVHDIQMSQLDPNYTKTIIEPQAVFNFNWSKLDQIQRHRSNLTVGRVRTTGCAQIAFMWWQLEMDPEGTIVLSCAPWWAHPLTQNGSIPWRDHWLQAIYYLPQEVPVEQGQSLYILSNHDQYSFNFNVTTDRLAVEQRENYRTPNCTCGLHITVPRNRIGQLNDSCRNKKFIQLMEQVTDSGTVALVLGNSSYITLAMAFNIKKLYYIETHHLLEDVLRDFCEANSLDDDKVEIFDSTEEFLDVVPAGEVNLVIGEPFFSTSLFPWDNLLFFNQIKQLRHHFAQDVQILPAECRIRAIGVHFQDLHKIRIPLGICEGFEMHDFDQLIQRANAIGVERTDAQPLWEYPGIAVSTIVDITTVTLPDTYRKNYHTNGTIQLDVEQMRKYNGCNGVALWTEWVFNDKLIVSNGPTLGPSSGDFIKWYPFTKQAVCLFEARKHIDYTFDMDWMDGTVSFKCI